MKQLKVTEKCNGCGICVLKCGYFEEDAEGNAVAAGGKSIAPEDWELVQSVIKECPRQAITVWEMKSTEKTGREGMEDLLQKLEEKEKTLQVMPVEAGGLRFSVKDFTMNAPYSPKEHVSNYSSESQARSAARDEFDKLCYSASAFRPVLKKVFVEYKLEKLKMYYTDQKEEESFYFQFNRSMERFLQQVYAEAREVGGDTFKLADSWCDFAAGPKEVDLILDRLKNFDQESTCSGIIDEFKSQGEYTSLRWYVDRMDFDYDEVYVGDGMFGKAKYKNQWYFSGFHSAAEEFASDLKSAIDDRSGAIAESACSYVNVVLKSYEESARAMLRQKIKEFRECIRQ